MLIRSLLTKSTPNNLASVFAAATLGILLSLPVSAQSSGPQPQSAGDQDLINADRPGIADGSAVVGSGIFQVESGIQQEYRRNGNSREHTFFVPTLLRFGIDSHWEFRLEGNTFTRVTTFDPTNNTSHDSGFAPVSLGLKYHIYHSSNDQLSLGTIVRVFPAWGSSDFHPQHTTGDIRLAADWNFAPRQKLSLNPNVGVARYEDDQGRAFTAELFAVTLNYLPTTKLNPFVDIGIQSPEEKNGSASAILDGGVAYIFGRNLQLDVEVGTRVHGDTGPKPFVGFGISWRTKFLHRSKS